ncbi:MAG: FAD-dependent oxidoreductase [Chloroflexota bacterium]|nr:FAD-dependent oxidoreductase [Chloroflexota bacterium]
MGIGEMIREPEQDVPVLARCDVLVVGGGPAGCAAAASAAELGAKTVLVERYGYLGGMSTGGLVVWIDRMSDWSGRQVISGFASELLDRLPREALLGPPREVWGTRTPELVGYWEDRACAFNGVVTWSPTVDPEMLKLAYMEIVLAKGVRLLLHSWAARPLQEGNSVCGVLFESKSGRQAILASVVIDTTGDGDVFALAGAAFESDIVAEDIHHKMNVAFLWAGVDMERYLSFRRLHADEHDAVVARGKQIGVVDRPHAMPCNDTCLFMGPRLAGYSCLDVEDLTEVEVESRRRMMLMLDFYRRNMPGFEHARVMLTAPQIGVRHSRRLMGTKKMTREKWAAGTVHEDEVAVSPSPDPKYPNVSVPFGCLVPATLDNLLAAGRNLSCDPVTHAFMREIPQCWAMGQAAGVAAAVAVKSRMLVRNVDISEVRSHLWKQGVFLHDERSDVPGSRALKRRP